ncbi:MAG: hypothetical protein ACI9GH_000631 [Candidatus Paceibacteria bacterium]|jgi:hypothetical protein
MKSKENNTFEIENFNVDSPEWKLGGIEVETPWPGKCQDRVVYVKDDDDDVVDIWFWFNKAKTTGVLNLYNSCCSSEWPALQFEGTYNECQDWIRDNGYLPR